MAKIEFETVKTALKRGGVIAYPTEAVYGLGCDPHNEQAVMRLLAMKQRDIDSGLIIIGATFAHIENFISELPENNREVILSSWPGPNTWLIPASEHCPSFIRGMHLSVAVRVISHPVAKEICNIFGGAIVSTSANIHGALPARTAKEVRQVFGTLVDTIVDAPVGNSINPSTIRDAITGKKIRG